MQLNDDLKFLVACCQTEPSVDDNKFILSYLNAERFDLNALISLANQHGVLPLVYKTMKKIVVDDPNFIQHFLSELKPYYMSIVQRNMLMTTELINIIKLLRENQMEAIAFKGPTLSQKAYGDITLRQFGDLDILIKRSDVSTMIGLLIAEGYVPQLELDTKLKETFLNALNVIGFYKNTSNILIEVHWELLSKNYAIAWDEDALWGQKRESITINKFSLQVLPCEEQLLYLCTHGSKHLFERLEWICDIDRYIKVNPDINWTYLLNEAKKRGIKRMLYLGLTLCQHFFRLELPELIEENIKQDKKLSELISKVIKSNFSETSKEGKNYSYLMLIWNLRENLPDKFRFTWYAFFAPQFDDFKFIQLPNYLAFLYPLVRQFRLIKKYIQR
ncbi:nucleotidyltransferase family protein [Sulfurovum sp. XTW-4]|uniref:Nucleotidyltransferase family protein n=1 Tax=Sulfurovum xiamenensis TaxID=3019066 RepID=A0ABT7QNS9_9BACT|nr:nucleotidyltransferase family protein [Sulfurovum xiamenensis]MDM5262625.1 nucleotidyltransferase family protein [Sulfurovum xiamenensis]